MTVWLGFILPVLLFDFLTPHDLPSSAAASSTSSPAALLEVASREKARGGQFRDDIWAHFDRAAEGKGFKAVCTYQACQGKFT